MTFKRFDFNQVSFDSSSSRRSHYYATARHENESSISNRMSRCPSPLGNPEKRSGRLVEPSVPIGKFLGRVPILLIVESTIAVLVLMNIVRLSSFVPSERISQ